jgi:hypothetical protein
LRRQTSSIFSGDVGGLELGAVEAATEGEVDEEETGPRPDLQHLVERLALGHDLPEAVAGVVDAALVVRDGELLLVRLGLPVVVDLLLLLDAHRPDRRQLG